MRADEFLELRLVEGLLLLVIGLGILGGFTWLMGSVLNIPLPRGILV